MSRPISSAQLRRGKTAQRLLARKRTRADEQSIDCSKLARYPNRLISKPTMAAALSSSFSLLRASRLARPYAIRNDAFSYRSFGSLCSFSAPLRPKRFVRHITASSDEEAAAKAAVDTGGPTIFDKIIAKEIPSDIVYEDDKVLAFRDINPQAPVHILIIPKLRNGLTQLAKAEARHGEILGQLLYASKIVADKEGIAEGFRVVINNGPGACQSVYHLHLHVLGGRQMKWPPG